MAHTPEPWKTVSRGDEYADDIDAFKGEGWNADVTIAMNIGKDNARRIVACVNWCKGNSTEGMERAVEIGRPYAVERDDAYGRELEITKQRDELLAALERMLRSYRVLKPVGYPLSDAEKIAESAIASVKGGA